MSALAPVVVSAAELPVPCVGGSCGSTVTSFVSQGAASVTAAGNTMTINQTSNNVSLNWRSFNISADGTVNFVQPGAASVALNRIYDGSPSQIFGALNANGRVYLLNQNGVLFKPGAQVNVGALIASSLDLTPEAVQNGILGAASEASAAAFAPFEGALVSGNVEVEPGATIKTPSGGQVFLFAPNVINRGSIATPGGQTVLAGGQSVYLLASSDPNLRGVLVEVGVGGTVTNGEAENATRDVNAAVGNIVAARGNVTLAGLAVNQLGRVSASTSVRANGSIRLQARDGAAVVDSPSGDTLSVGRGGTLTLGERSQTIVGLDADDATAVDVSEQLRSDIRLDGHRVNLLSGSTVAARGGNIAITASTGADRINVENPEAFPAQDDSRIYVASGVTLDVSGAASEVAMERNSLRVELRGSQLADSPQQRDGALRGEAVSVDVRASGTRADGSRWQGTPLADVSANIAGIGRDVRERNSRGGTITIASHGDAIVAPDSTVDISGGQVRYRDGFVAVSQVLGADGRIYSMENADRDRTYAGVASGYSVRDLRWGVDASYASYGVGSGDARFERGYVEGKDAGALRIIAAQAVLDGDVIATVTPGANQRLPSAVLPADVVFRPYDQLPLGGRLTIGASSSVEPPDFVSTRVIFDPSLVLPTLTGFGGRSFDPTRDPLPESVGINVQPGWLRPGGIAAAAIAANESIVVPADVALSLPAGGTLDLQAAEVSILGDIDVPSGTVNAIARQTITQQIAAGARPELIVGAASSITARGGWINDNPALNPQGASAPLWINGGSVTLAARQGDFVAEPGSLIDVSAGAWRRGSGSIMPGVGGSISLTSTPAVTPIDQLPAASRFVLGAQLLGFALERGGSLSIEANELCVSVIECNDSVGTLWLTPERFETGGFGSFSLTANARGLQVASDTSVRVRQANLELLGDVSTRATGTSMQSLTRTLYLPDELRRPANLTLRAATTTGPDGFDPQLYAVQPDLRIAAGAEILLDAAASLSLRANTRLIVQGALQANSGTVSLTLDNTLAQSGYLPSQGIWLSDTARIDVSGSSRVLQDNLGRRTGEVLRGGSVTLNAQRGYVIASTGSVVDVSGTTAELDVRVSPRAYERRTVSSAGGDISITAAEGAILGSTMLAGGGAASDYGGSFSLTLDTAQRGDRTRRDFEFPRDSREIRLVSTTAPTLIAPGIDVPAQFTGRAAVGADQLQSAGFDSVALAARNVASQREFPDGTTGLDLASTGRIVVEGGVDLSTRSRLALDASSVALAGGDARLASAYVAMGNSDTREFGQSTPSVTAASAGTLHLRGGMLDLFGDMSVLGAETLVLDSSGDIRLRGVVETAGSDTRYSGSLTAPRDIELRAAQIYPTTLTDFVLQSADTDAGAIRTVGQGTATPVLSAAGRVTLLAHTVDHGGALLAPYGAIEIGTPQSPVSDFIARAGSVLSTVASTTVPFGTTQGGFDWTYLINSRTVVVGGDGIPVPERSVALNAQTIDFGAGATIDVAAGGDLQAYEWVPGVGGSSDVLDASESPGLFAILPSLSLQYAPYDGSADYQNSALRPGDAVHLSASPGLAEGTYVLLPARYALLPGAFLVSAAGGHQDLVASEVLPQLDGSTIVSGYRTISGTDVRDSRTSGFLVRPGQDALRLAQYDISRASDFFRAQAIERELPVPRLAGDAGRVAFIASSSLNLAGTIVGTAPQGRGAAVDVSSSHLRIVSDPSQGDDGVVLLSATQLAELDAESLLIGGQRRTTADGTQIDVTADTVEVASGVELEGDEIILAARDTVAVGESAAIRASGEARDAVETLLLQGDSALLRISSADQVDVTRDSVAGATGSLDIAASALLSAVGGSVTADASLDTLSFGRLDVRDGSLSLGASRISFGDPSGPVSGLVLDDAQLSTLGLRELVLNSRSSFDFHGASTLRASELVLNGGGLVAAGAATQAAIQADRVTLTNRNSIAAPVAAGDGSLTIAAGEILLGEGAVGLAGFGDATLLADSQLQAVASGSLTADGNLTLSGARIAGAAGKNYSFSSTGALTLLGSSGQAPAEVAPLGALLQFSGQSVHSSANIAAPAGIVEMRAVDALVVDAGTIDVAGRASMFDGVAVAADAGRIRLSSTNGAVSIGAGATLDLRAAGEGQAGRLSIAAEHGSATLGGTLLGAAADAERSGEVGIDALSLGDLTALNSILQAGGFFSERSLRQRGAGDLVLDGAWRVQNLDVTADQGSIRVAGTIDASGAIGGSLELSASKDIAIDGSVTVRGAAQAQGGSIDLRARDGGVRMSAGSSLELSAAGSAAALGGTLQVRTKREAIASLLDADANNDLLRFAGSITGARRIDLEGYRVYDAAGLNVDAADTNPLFADAQAFMADAGRVAGALGFTSNAAFRMLPGLELVTTGDFVLSQAWDLSQWRFGANAAPGVLTLRAGGNVSVNAALTDGFSGTSATLLPQGSESWSYRLVSGSDLGSSNLMAVTSAGLGNLTVTSSTLSRGLIRTGTGSIDIAAGGNVRLVDQRSVIYTAGTPGEGIPLPLRQAVGGLGGLPYPVRGGDIDIYAGGDVVGAASNQLVTSWLWRTGTTADVSQPNATAWTVNFGTFEQNIGALGGGNVAVEARGDVRDLSVSVPSIGRQVGGTTPGQSRVEVVGGGTIDVEAGRNLLGGSFYAGLGTATLRANDAIANSVTSPTRLAPVLALGDAQMNIVARTGAAIETAVNPTLLPQARDQITGLTFASHFATYSPDAAVDVRSVAGDVRIGTVGVQTLASTFNRMTFNDNLADRSLRSLSLLPPTLRASALSGDLVLGSSVTMFPAARGDLSLFADGDLRIAPVQGAADIFMSDADPATLPSVLAPTRANTFLLLVPSDHADVPLHGRDDATDSDRDETPVRLVARQGSISAPSGGSLTLQFPKAARIVAGTDLLDLPVVHGQNLLASDVTSLIAGRDIRYSLNREPETGAIRASDREILLGGPGRLELRAGRNVDLQTSKGVTTMGATANPALSRTGASIDVLAGLNGLEPDVAGFIDAYLAGGTAYDSLLIDYMEQQLATSGLTKEEALAALRSRGLSEQLGLIQSIYFNELLESGTTAADPDPELHDDYSQGFAAIEALFPGGNPDVKGGETNRYQGDIRLYFSKIYTLFGGSINLLAPGGEVNVGLAAPPSSFGVTKGPADLGVVVRQSGSVNAYTYDDLLVNESRVFAADGGDIMVWSTRGDIDAGRGAKTAISAPPPVVTIDPNGQIEVQFSPALTGSGIQTLATSDGVKPGNVGLFAPRGVVNAGDAGIVAGNLTIAATAVLGADNIQVSGVAVGVPVDAGGLGASLAGVSSAASGAANAATSLVEPESTQQAEPSAAQAALSWLDVFVIGLGEEGCSPSDTDCLKRQN
ncbi:MAG TPA: filamentous hemagglutinin family protein [Steroidobacteraceae bacterium]|nr:filamentous hemagglutinin family protein [Steroidobacteraceae bacterium]